MLRELITKLTVRNTLYYPGCLTKYALPEIRENYEKILRRMDIDFITLKELEVCCGSPVHKAGYKQDFDEVRRKNLEMLERYGVARIITNCPACFHMFREHYKFNVDHITTVVAKNIKKFDAKQHGPITYHDPCHLGRYGGVYDEPRAVLAAVGFEVVEMRNNHEKSLCCGGGGGLKSNSTTLANRIAGIRLSQVKTQKLVTPCPMCYAHLKENAKDIEVLEFSEVLV